jgi:hypothetical protein
MTTEEKDDLLFHLAGIRTSVRIVSNNIDDLSKREEVCHHLERTLRELTSLCEWLK